MKKTLMQRLLDAGYPVEEIFHHESDLYVYATGKTKKVILEWCRENGYSPELFMKLFHDNETGKPMYDITKLEHPEQLPEWLKKQSGINAFNGKNNVYSESFYRLFAWMDDYIQDLRNPLETKQCRDQVLMMTFGKENRTEMEG